MGLKPKFTNSQLDAFVLARYYQIEKKLIESLKFVGEGFVKEARKMTKMQGGFGDITGNLRSSIGYFITKNGEVIFADIELSEKGTDKKTGFERAKQFAHEIKKSDGLMLYGVAGMEYARDVESRGQNVISLQSDTAIVELKQILTDWAA